LAGAGVPFPKLIISQFLLQPWRDGDDRRDPVRLIRLSLIHASKPVADEVTGWGSQGNIGQRSRFTSARGRHADHQPAKEKNRATARTRIRGKLGDSAGGLLRGEIFIRGNRKNPGGAMKRFSEEKHASPLYLSRYNADLFRPSSSQSLDHETKRCVLERDGVTG
jgi:hypothetical protein